MVRAGGFWPVPQEEMGARLAREQPLTSWLCLLHAAHQDLTDSSSFERAKFWVKELRSLEEVGEQTSLED